MVWILDLDGVVWLLNDAISGSKEAIEKIRRKGDEVRFVTNNSVLTVSSYLKKFEGFGIEAHRDEVITSSMAAASLVKEGERAYVIGGPGLREEVSKVAKILSEDEADSRRAGVDVVLVGWDHDFSYSKLTKAMWAIEAGARLIATNSDTTYPTPEGLIPGAGSIVASVVAAGRCEAIFAGKPNTAIADLVRSTFTGGAVMVGDRYSTDGLFAETLGVPFYLVKSEVSEEIPGDLPQPDQTAGSLYDIVDSYYQE
jgi:glycerol 3-phosphatase-2